LLTAVNQDPFHARFSSCFLPYIPAIPTAIALSILVFHALWLLLPRRFWPEWSDAFIKEPEGQPEQLEPKAKRPLGRLTAALLVTSSVGFAFQALAMFYVSSRFQEAFSTVSWVCYTYNSPSKC
jgi:hypothetical protein